ncbi:protein PET100 homolog, mitochondrial isoform X1 [Haemorhous mexicanus]|uniref:protein PET100 homolog, mitochondrial isoform X1 n=1 Tax=Haemorhous mexicanus TaxID=30427 RepID=UPI0028BF255B|nr:protein PET100 homolog, mitochondrial isoform X1 [Haemorhous mexicanus]
MGVKLEILRVTQVSLSQMCLYLSFPVAVFWVSNQAELFQRHVIDRKREIFPPDTPERRQAMAELKQRLRERKGTQA